MTVRPPPLPDTGLLGTSVNARHIEKARKTILSAGERLLAGFHGQALSRESYGMDAQRKGGLSLHDYLIVTDQRVIMWARGIFKGSTDSFSYVDISSVEEARSMFFGEIVLNVRGAKERFRNMVKADAPVAAKLIRDKISELHTTVSTRLAPDDVFAKIERLGELRDRGLVSSDEFEAKRVDLLSRIKLTILVPRRNSQSLH